MKKFRIPYTITITGSIDVNAETETHAFNQARKWLMKQESKDQIRTLMENGVGRSRVVRDRIEIVQEEEFESELHDRYRKKRGSE